MLSVRKTTAAVLADTDKNLIIDEIQLPEQLTFGQVLIEVHSSGICGAQINEIKAIKGPDKFLPHLLGHEGYGKVIEIGQGVTTVKPHDLVVMHWRPGSGIQSFQPNYLWRGKQLNAGWVTTFNKHAVVSENRITKISRLNNDKTIMPLLGCALTTALGILENEAQISLRDSLLIFGAGGVGLLIVKLAKLFGVTDITVVDIYESKLVKARELGASNTLLFQNKNKSLKQLYTIFTNGLPSIAIDTTGNTNAIEICYEVSSPNARVILVGVPKVGDNASIHTLPLHFGKVIKGSEGGKSNPERDVPFLMDLISAGKLDFHDFPRVVFPLAKVNEAISSIISGANGRMILDLENS
jgi:S-(hydroxymethyl)glutathione dehydrogenase/alcohol dehydrogenase